jgi:hypothetical protein
MYIYALLYGVAFSGTSLLDEPLIFLITGLVIVVPGIIIFIRFLRDNPLPDQGASNE